VFRVPAIAIPLLRHRRARALEAHGHAETREKNPGSGPPGTSEYTMHLEEKDGRQVLVYTIGKAILL
jgi:hypothetical protein